MAGVKKRVMAMGWVSGKYSFWWVGLWQALRGGAGPGQTEWKLGWGWGAQPTVLQGRSRGGSSKDKAELRKALSTRWALHCVNGRSRGVRRDQIYILHKSRGPSGNLSRVLTFISFNSVIPEEIIKNAHKDLWTAVLITALFIIVQSPK